MKIICLSDTHGLHNEIIQNGINLPDGDILIHAGDLTNIGGLKEYIEFNTWIKSLPYQYKIVIAGNHDFGLQNENKLVRQFLTDMIYLEDEFIEIEGIKIYGTPWSLTFYDWAFMGTEEFLAAKYKKIPNNIDILITHTPPYLILDRTATWNYIGSKALLEKIFEIKPRFVIFGHNHEGYGKLEINDITFINASLANENYDIVNKPFVIEI